MTINSLSSLSASIEEKLHEAETEGLGREEVAERLEAHATAVRNGYTYLPENRGEWWHDVHGDRDEQEHSTTVAARSD